MSRACNHPCQVLFNFVVQFCRRKKCDKVNDGRQVRLCRNCRRQKCDKVNDGRQVRLCRNCMSLLCFYSCNSLIYIVSGLIKFGRQLSVVDPEEGGGDVRPPKKKWRERERERGVVFRPSIKHSQHSFIRLFNVINHYIFLPVALPLSFI